MSVVYSQHGVIVKTAGIDVIGGRRYNTIQMPDGKTWLAENLDFKFCTIGGNDIPSSPNAWYYNNDETTYGWNGYKCGLLYNWYAVKFLNDYRSDLCPGWHVPSKDELETLATEIGGVSIGSTKLKALDDSVTSGFPSGWNGTDDFGFGSLPSGYRSGGNFSHSNDYAGFWSNNEYSSSNAYDIRFNTSASITISNSAKGDAVSLRLVRDSQ